MAWYDIFRVSANVEDRRKVKTAAKTSAKVGGPVAFAFMAGFCAQQAVTPETDFKAPIDAAGNFVAHVLGDIEDQWKLILNDKYRPAQLVLYTSNTATKGCGRAQTAIGPLYCPGDEQIYLDLSFFAELQTKACKKIGDACEFSRAYVIAHEWGHHVQNILGILRQHESQASGPLSESVRIELGADCYAGIWAGRSNSKFHNVTPAMVNGAWQAARFGGDNHYGVPLKEYTHGSSAQRSKWFLKGYDGKQLASCDTFAGDL